MQDNNDLSGVEWKPENWLLDEGLRLCSFAAKGLWADMLSLMMRSKVLGALLTNSGDAADSNWIAKQVFASPGEVEALLRELESHCVPSRFCEARFDKDRPYFPDLKPETIVSRYLFDLGSLSRKRAVAGRMGGQARGHQGNSKKGSKALARFSEGVVVVSKQVVSYYGSVVKQTSKDSSQPQARINVCKLLAEEGYTHQQLSEAVKNYGDWCRANEKPQEYRKNAGNFFGRERVFEGFLPGHAPPLPRGPEPLNPYKPAKEE